jgi:hypothetical protein
MCWLAAHGEKKPSPNRIPEKLCDTLCEDEASKVQHKHQIHIYCLGGHSSYLGVTLLGTMMRPIGLSLSSCGCDRL